MKTSAVLFVAGLCMAVSSASAAATFQRLGLPAGNDPFNPAFTDSYGVSDDGVVVGSMNVPGVGFLGFVWTAGGGLQQLGGIQSNSQLYARAITPDGQTIVGENTSPNVAFRRVGGGGLENLSYPSKGYEQSAANDVSNDGSVVVGLLGRLDDGTYRAGRWVAGSGWTDLGVAQPGDYESVANAVSGDGSVVAGYSVGNAFTAMTWTAGEGMVALAHPLGITANTAIIAMAADASVFAGQADDEFGRSQAAAWYDDGTSRILDKLPDFDLAAAYAVSGDGSLIGGTVESTTLNTMRAVLWNADGEVIDLQNLLTTDGNDLAGWNLLAVTEISQNGLYVTGRGINPDGLMEAFVVTVPSPMTAGPLVLMAFRRRRR